MSELGEWIAALSSGDSEQAEAAASAAPEDRAAALEALDALLAEGDPEARWWATRALAEFEEEAAGDLLARALADADEAVRHCAAVSLRHAPHPAAIEALIERLSAEDHLLARLAGDALIAQGEAATPGLLDVLEKGDEAAKVEAARALAHIGDLRSVSALFKLLDSGSTMLEHWAGEGLEKMGIGMQFFSTGK